MHHPLYCPIYYTVSILTGLLLFVGARSGLFKIVYMSDSSLRQKISTCRYLYLIPLGIPLIKMEEPRFCLKCFFIQTQFLWPTGFQGLPDSGLCWRLVFQLKEFYFFDGLGIHEFVCLGKNAILYHICWLVFVWYSWVFVQARTPFYRISVGWMLWKYSWELCSCKTPVL